MEETDISPIQKRRQCDRHTVQYPIPHLSAVYLVRKGDLATFIKTKTITLLYFLRKSADSEKVADIKQKRLRFLAYHYYDDIKERGK